MTRKDYIAIARAMNAATALAAHVATKEDALALVRTALCDAFEKDNARFDRTRFYLALDIPAETDNDGRTDTNCVYCGGFIGQGKCQSSACIDGRTE